VAGKETVELTDVTLAVCHRLSDISTYGLMAIGRELTTQPMPLKGYGMLFTATVIRMGLCKN